MTRDPQTVAKELVSNGFVTTLKIRTNLNTRKLDSNAIYRLRENKDKIYTGDYVKVPGGHRAIPFENFDKSKMTRVRNKVRIGEYLLPVNGKIKIVLLVQLHLIEWNTLLQLWVAILEST